jgi:hypothetical protein
VPSLHGAPKNMLLGELTKYFDKKVMTCRCLKMTISFVFSPAIDPGGSCGVI